MEESKFKFKIKKRNENFDYYKKPELKNIFNFIFEKK